MSNGWAQVKSIHFWMIVFAIGIYVVQTNIKSLGVETKEWLQAGSMFLTLLGYQLGVRWDPSKLYPNGKNGPAYGKSEETK